MGQVADVAGAVSGGGPAAQQGKGVAAAGAGGEREGSLAGGTIGGAGAAPARLLLPAVDSAIGDLAARGHKGEGSLRLHCE